MKSLVPPSFAAAAVLLLLAAASAQSTPVPQVIPLPSGAGDLPLLTGAPQTAGLRSGLVRLQPTQTVGWHTTGAHEEALVILRGHGAALIQGQKDRPFVAPAVVYIPPATRHNIRNTGAGVLEYVYVVAPTVQEDRPK